LKELVPLSISFSLTTAEMRKCQPLDQLSAMCNQSRETQSLHVCSYYAQKVSQKFVRVEGRIHGIRVCGNIPAILHLLFPDDLLVLCKADEADTA
jgi:hypothetical protein